MFLKDIIGLVLAITIISSQFVLAEVYITAEEAIKKSFPDLERLETEERILDHQPIRIFKVFKDNKVIGWGVVLNEMGKNMPITFLVTIGQEFKVLDVYLLEFRDLFGSEIKRQSFLKQFRGKTLRSALSVGRDIDAVTGATISSHSATSAVRKSLDVVEKLRKGL